MCNVENVSVLLIDLDNCPNQIEQLAQNLEKYARIIVCYGSQPPKISLNLALLLANPIYHKRLEFVGMQKSGKNAADFGLCFYAGRLSAQMSVEQTEYLIVSNDADLDHAVNLLIQQGCKAKRIGNKHTSESAILDLTIIDDLPQKITLIATEYRSKKSAHFKSRPAKKATLLNDIRAFCRNKFPNHEQEIFDFLEQQAYFKVEGEKIIYLTGEK
ncbi:hypothetical protein THII_0438 [Thioploca ingrica]|uniref:PIN-like domain-containing protein n=1 Tax=Thioploca ingrica TaxID=40754 RepID=A0A090AIQ2_9GAMM|nr:hypothetical protein THII_0438 [Thioploca ingrica]